MRLFSVLFFIGCCSILNAQEIRSVKVTEIEKFIAESKGPLVISMWATWCKPCIEEIPYFLEVIKKQNKNGDSVDVLLLSLDFKEAFPKDVRSFANKKKFDVPIAWLNETNADYFCPKVDSAWSGAIPATLFINNSKGYRNFIEGKIHKDEFKSEIKRLIE